MTVAVNLTCAEAVATLAHRGAYFASHKPAWSLGGRGGTDRNSRVRVQGAHRRADRADAATVCVMPPGLPRRLELNSTDELIQGRIRDHHEEPIAFTGWLELIAAVQRLTAVRPVPSRAAEEDAP